MDSSSKTSGESLPTRGITTEYSRSPFARSLFIKWQFFCFDSANSFSYVQLILLIAYLSLFSSSASLLFQMHTYGVSLSFSLLFSVMDLTSFSNQTRTLNQSAPHPPLLNPIQHSHFTPSNLCALPNFGKWQRLAL